MYCLSDVLLLQTMKDFSKGFMSRITENVSTQDVSSVFHVAVEKADVK